MLKLRRKIPNVFTKSKPQRQIHNVVWTLPQLWIVVLAHSISWLLYWQRRYNKGIQRGNQIVKFTTCPRSRYYDVVPRQLCKKPQIWTIPSHMVTFPRICFKFWKKFNSDTFFWYAGSILLWHQIQVIISHSYSKSSTKVAFERFRDIKNDQQQSCNLKLCNKTSPI